jgi:hypothetical protein
MAAIPRNFWRQPARGFTATTRGRIEAELDAAETALGFALPSTSIRHLPVSRLPAGPTGRRNPDQLVSAAAAQGWSHPKATNDSRR